MFSLYCADFPIAKKNVFDRQYAYLYIIVKLEMCQYDTVGDRYERKTALGIRDVRLFG